MNTSNITNYKPKDFAELLGVSVKLSLIHISEGFADALCCSIPGHAGNKPTVLGIALLAGIPAGRPLCGRNVAAGMVMLAAFMGTA